MGLFSFLFKPKPKQNWYSYENVVALTFELIDGISDDQRNQAINKSLELASNSNRSAPDNIAEDLLTIFGDTDWTWREWEFWQPICVSKNLYGWHMMFCDPCPDTIDWKKERKKIKPHTIVNSLKVQEVKDLISKYSRNNSIKTKSDAIEYLESNQATFNKIRDEKIIEKWNSVPHRTHATKKEIARLLSWTIYDRINFVKDVSEAKRMGQKYKIIWIEDFDKRFHAYANKTDENPWKHKDLLPNFPGGIASVEAIIR